MEHLQTSLSTFLNTISEHLPGVVGALVVFLIGSLVAYGVSRLVGKLLARTQLDNRLFGGAGSSVSPERFIAKLVYYLVMIIVLLVVLEMLGVSQVLDPLKNMVDKFFAFIPNLIGAGLIGFIGWMIANFVSDLVGVGGSAINAFGDRVGISASSANIDLVGILKKVVFIIIFVPILIAALDTLGIKTISEPATAMLNDFMNAIPKIFAAIIIIGVFYFVGRFVTGLVRDLLQGMGVDQMAANLNLSSMLGTTQVASLLANTAFFFIMFFGLITGLEKLEFTQLNEMLTEVLSLAGRIFFGLLLMVLGNYLANIAYDTIGKSEDGQFLASIARFAILGLFLGISLNQMGIADNIVNLAFGLTLGAIAVATALAFGLGGREAAGKQMEHILRKFRKE
ncbi:MAG: mechanosensitive ion channel [Bacteroidota bacterium]